MLNAHERKQVEEFVINDIQWAVNSGNRYPVRTMLGRGGQLIDVFASEFDRQDLDLFVAEAILQNKKPPIGHKVPVSDVLLIFRLRKALLSVAYALNNGQTRQETIQKIKYLLDDSYSDQLFNFVCRFAKPCLDKMPEL